MKSIGELLSGIWEGIKEIFGKIVPQEYSHLGEHPFVEFDRTPRNERPQYKEAKSNGTLPKPLWITLTKCIDLLMDRKTTQAPMGKMVTETLMALCGGNNARQSRFMGLAMFIYGVQALSLMSLLTLEATLTGGVKLRQPFTYKFAWFEMGRAPIIREFVNVPEDQEIYFRGCEYVRGHNQ